jgi:hypothetical protein
MRWPWVLSVRALHKIDFDAAMAYDLSQLQRGLTPVLTRFYTILEI